MVEEVPPRLFHYGAVCALKIANFTAGCHLKWGQDSDDASVRFGARNPVGRGCWSGDWEK